jgi:hypothetical protein
MKPKILVMFLVGALISPLGVSRAIAQAPTQMQVLDQMKANVTLIPASAEKDRWQSNTEMWQIMIARKGNVSGPQLDLLKTYFEKMQANVAAITEPEEQERWQTNMFMWAIMIRHMGTEPPARFLVPLNGYFGRMQANVGEIAQAAEKDRWQANVDLWKAMIARLDKMSTQAERKLQ